VPETLVSSPPNSLGITAANRARNLPLKSVKHLVLRAVSSGLLNLASPLSEGTHVKYELSQFMIIQNPRCRGINNVLELSVVPLGDFVGNK
jgi:hypothetical protein